MAIINYFLGVTFDFIIYIKQKLSTRDTHLLYVYSTKNINYKYQRDGDRERERDWNLNFPWCNWKLKISQKDYAER